MPKNNRAKDQNDLRVQRVSVLKLAGLGPLFQGSGLFLVGVIGT